MDSIVVSDTGFPADNELIRRMTTAFSEPINAITKMLGDYVILDGVVVDGNTASAGSVIINGEFLPFVESSPVADGDFGFEIIEESTDLFYDNGSTQPLQAYVRRYARAKSIEPFLVRINEFKRLENLVDRGSTVIYGRAQTSSENGEVYYGDIQDFQKLTSPEGAIYFKVTLNETIDNYVPIVENSIDSNQDAYTAFSISNVQISSFEIWPEVDNTTEFYANYIIQILQ